MKPTNPVITTVRLDLLDCARPRIDQGSDHRPSRNETKSNRMKVVPAGEIESFASTTLADMKVHLRESESDDCDSAESPRRLPG